MDVTLYDADNPDWIIGRYWMACIPPIGATINIRRADGATSWRVADVTLEAVEMPEQDDLIHGAPSAEVPKVLCRPA